MRPILIALGIAALIVTIAHLATRTEVAPEERPNSRSWVQLGRGGMNPMADDIEITGPTDPIKCGETVTLTCRQNIQGGGATYGALFYSTHETGPWTYCRGEGDRPTIDPAVGCPGDPPWISPTPFAYSDQGQEFSIPGVSFYGPVWLLVRTYSNWAGDEPNPDWQVHESESRYFEPYYPAVATGELDDVLGEYIDVHVGAGDDAVAIKGIFEEPHVETLNVSGRRPVVIVETALVENVSLGDPLEIPSLERSFTIRSTYLRADETTILILEDLG